MDTDWTQINSIITIILIFIEVCSTIKHNMKRNFMEVFGYYDKVKQGKDYTISRAVKQ